MPTDQLGEIKPTITDQGNVSHQNVLHLITDLDNTYPERVNSNRNVIVNITSNNQVGMVYGSFMDADWVAFYTLQNSPITNTKKSLVSELGSILIEDTKNIAKKVYRQFGKTQTKDTPETSKQVMERKNAESSELNEETWKQQSEQLEDNRQNDSELSNQSVESENAEPSKWSGDNLVIEDISNSGSSIQPVERENRKQSESSEEILKQQPEQPFVDNSSEELERKEELGASAEWEMARVTQNMMVKKKKTLNKSL